MYPQLPEGDDSLRTTGAGAVRCSGPHRSSWPRNISNNSACDEPPEQSQRQLGGAANHEESNEPPANEAAAMLAEMEVKDIRLSYLAKT